MQLLGRGGALCALRAPLSQPSVADADFCTDIYTGALSNRLLFRIRLKRETYVREAENRDSGGGV